MLPPRYAHPRMRQVQQRSTNQNDDTDSAESLQEIAINPAHTAVHMSNGGHKRTGSSGGVKGQQKAHKSPHRSKHSNMAGKSSQGHGGASNLDVYHSNSQSYLHNQNHTSDSEGFDNPAIDFSDDLTISRHQRHTGNTPPFEQGNPDSYRLAEEEEQIASSRKVKPKRHRDVPPIDLSSFASDSDEEETKKQRKKRAYLKKKHSTAQVL